MLESATDYTLLLVAVSDARRHRSSALQLLPVNTRDVTPPVHLTNPVVSNIGESNFSLTVTLSEAGEALTQCLHFCSVCSKSMYESPSIA